MEMRKYDNLSIHLKFSKIFTFFKRDLRRLLNSTVSISPAFEIPHPHSLITLCFPLRHVAVPTLLGMDSVFHGVTESYPRVETASPIPSLQWKIIPFIFPFSIIFNFIFVRLIYQWPRIENETFVSDIFIETESRINIYLKYGIFF